MAIGEALGSIVGGFLGNNAAKMDRAHQKKLMKQMIEEYKKIGYPPDYAREIVIEELQRTGQFTPELEQDLSDAVAESELAKIEEDPAIREAQMEALTAMQKRGKVGLAAEDRAALNQVRSEVQRDSEAKRQQILQQMQARGMGGSGAELMAQLQSAQGAADQAAAGSDTIMAQASQRALEALGQSSRMAGEVRGQDLGVEEMKARAIDERNKFLAENAISRQARNVGQLNEAQLFNLKEQQRIADANVQARNLEKQRQRTAEQAQYADKLNYAAGITGQQGKVADFYGARADQKAQAQKDMATGIGGLADVGVEEAGGIAGIASMFSDEDLKTNIDYTDDEVQAWLDSLSLAVTGKKR